LGNSKAAPLTAFADFEGVSRVLNESFRNSRPETCRLLVGLAEIRSFKAGQTVVRQGDDTLTGLVLEGHVAYRRMTFDGREVIPRIVSTGGLAALLPMASRPSAAEMLALTPCRVALWSGRELQAVATGDAGLAIDLLENVLLTFEAVVGGLDGLLHQDAVGRVARVLQQHKAMFFGEPPILTRAHLPALVGTSREMTGRVLRRLETEGVVARDGRVRLRLLDAARLAETAAPRPAPADGGG
jgi:CRP-like cAMP-binding protein